MGFPCCGLGLDMLMNFTFPLYTEVWSTEPIPPVFLCVYEKIDLGVATEKISLE